MLAKYDALIALLEARSYELAAASAGEKWEWCRHKSTGGPLVEAGWLRWVKKKDSYDQVYELTDKGRAMCDRLLETAETFEG